MPHILVKGHLAQKLLSGQTDIHIRFTALSGLL